MTLSWTECGEQMKLRPFRSKTDVFGDDWTWRRWGKGEGKGGTKDNVCDSSIFCIDGFSKSIVYPDRKNSQVLIL